jgi:hypothetical protein
VATAKVISQVTSAATAMSLSPYGMAFLVTRLVLSCYQLSGRVVRDDQKKIDAAGVGELVGAGRSQAASQPGYVGYAEGHRPFQRMTWTLTSD